MTALRGPRGLAVATALCAVGAGLVLVSLGRVWVSLHSGSGSSAGFSFSNPNKGHDLVVAGSALALVALAAAAAVLATRGWLRRGVGVVVLAAGATLVVQVLLARRHATYLGFAQYVPLGTDTHPALNAWRWVALAGALLVAAGGLLTVLCGGGWPGLGRRYDAPGAPKPRDPWTALDQGDDPTL